MIKRLFAVVAALLVGAAGPDPGIEAKTRAFLDRPQQIAAIREALVDQASSLPLLCPRVTLTPVQLLIAMPPTPRFDASGTMVEGSVRQRVASSGCGAFQPLLNVWVVAAPGQPTRTFTAYPGTSAASVDVQRDAMPTATVAAGRVIGGCGSLDVIDTREIGFDTPGEGARAWQEVWLISGCDRFATVRLHFIPGTVGRTKVEAPPGGVRRVELK